MAWLSRKSRIDYSGAMVLYTCVVIAAQLSYAGDTVVTCNLL
jgi:hypothetical protein